MKSRIPKFTSIEEEREFWQRHSVTEFLEEFTPVTVKFLKPRRKTAISVRLSTAEADTLRSILARLTNATRPHAPAHHKS